MKNHIMYFLFILKLIVYLRYVYIEHYNTNFLINTVPIAIVPNIVIVKVV